MNWEISAKLIMKEFVVLKVPSMTQKRKWNSKTTKSVTWTLPLTIFGENCKIIYFLILLKSNNKIIQNFLSNSIKPTLKKVSKYENKFAKLQKKAAEFNFRNQLKTVKKKEFTLEEEDKEHEVFIYIDYSFSTFPVGF